MAASGKKLSEQDKERLRAELHREAATRRKGYRDRALKLFPHVCASCGRGFEGRRLSQLTVHHKDHDHTNNPPDGSNWELLCLYCHDHEHEKYLMAGHGGGRTTETNPEPSGFTPFEGLDGLMEKEDASE